MLRRGGIWAVRVHVPVDLRPLIGRRDLWRSVGTAYRRDARLRAAVFRGHKGPRFVRLQREHRRMSRQQIDALVGEYLSAITPLQIRRPPPSSRISRTASPPSMPSSMDTMSKG